MEDGGSQEDRWGSRFGLDKWSDRGEFENRRQMGRRRVKNFRARGLAARFVEDGREGRGNGGNGGRRAGGRKGATMMGGINRLEPKQQFRFQGCRAGELQGRAADSTEDEEEMVQEQVEEKRGWGSAKVSRGRGMTERKAAEGEEEAGRLGLGLKNSYLHYHYFQI